MSAADLRESVAWAPELLVAMAKAHDQEASAQKGEPSPWDVSIFGEPDQSFVAERVVAMQCALRAIADAGFVIVPREPTEEMVAAGEDSIRMVTNYSRSDMLAVTTWNDMLAARLKPTLRVVGQ